MHRDIKPHNLLVNQQCHVMISDFGLSRALPSRCEKAQRPLSPVGFSPGYVPPEVLKGMPYDEKADIWSVGVVLY